MKYIEVTIQGVSPLLMNRFHEAAQAAVSRGTSTALKSNGDLPREQAKPKLYTDKEGNLILPGPNIYSCLIEAGKFLKLGKNKLTTMKTSLVPAGLWVDDVECRLYADAAKADAEWEVDSRPIVNPSTQGRRICHRPRLDEWVMAFSISVDIEMFDLKLVRTLIDYAGSRIGLGDFRPQRKGPFGRFKVIHWEIKD